MTNQELLAKLEESHSIQAQAILELRELVKHETSFTTEAKAEAQERVEKRVGTKQVKTDEEPDLRKKAELEEETKS